VPDILSRLLKKQRSSFDDLCKIPSFTTESKVRLTSQTFGIDGYTFHCEFIQCSVNSKTFREDKTKAIFSQALFHFLEILHEISSGCTSIWVVLTRKISVTSQTCPLAQTQLCLLHLGLESCFESNLVHASLIFLSVNLWSIFWLDKLHVFLNFVCVDFHISRTLDCLLGTNPCVWLKFSEVLWLEINDLFRVYTRSKESHAFDWRCTCMAAVLCPSEKAIHGSKKYWFHCWHREEDKLTVSPCREGSHQLWFEQEDDGLLRKCVQVFSEKIILDNIALFHQAFTSGQW